MKEHREMNHLRYSSLMTVPRSDGDFPITRSPDHGDHPMSQSLALPSPMRLNSSAMDMTEALIWGAIVAFGGFIFWLIRWWDGRGRENFRDRRTTGWPVVPATVENYEIVYSTRRVFTLVVYYSYSVNSKFYSGEFSRYRIGTEASARDAATSGCTRRSWCATSPTIPRNRFSSRKIP